MWGRIFFVGLRVLVALFIIAAINQTMMSSDTAPSQGPKFVRPGEEAAADEDPAIWYDLAGAAESVWVTLQDLIAGPPQEEPASSLERLKARNQSLEIKH